MTLPIIIATWFGSGLLKPAPGTWGSLAALPFACLIGFLSGNSLWLLLAAALLFPIGIWAATHYDRQSGSHDASEIVVDEVVGVWITLAFFPLDWIYILAGFILFRIFDILKPWPIRLIDARVKGGFGVMIDDVIAGLFAAATLWAGGGL